MKRIRISMAALVVTAALVASFAFTRKPVNIVDYLYQPSSGQKVIDPNDANAIQAMELPVTSSWNASSIGTHSNASRLKGIEFDMDQLVNLQNAIDGVNDYYTTGATAGTLPVDGGTLPKVVGGTPFNVTVFRF